MKSKIKKQDFQRLFIQKQGKLLPAGLGVYDPNRRPKRSGSKVKTQGKGESKFSARRLSSNHEAEPQPAKINNFVGDKESPSKSAAAHPAKATYKSLSKVKNDNRLSLDGLLAKSRKGSRAGAQKQHNTSQQNKDPKPIQPSMFDRRKRSADDSSKQRDELKEESKKSAATAHQSRRQSLSKTTPLKTDEEQKDETNIVTKFAFATRVGYIPNNPYKENQDNFLLNPNLLKLPACHFFGVCDGHGQNGKHVSGFIKKRLPVLVEQGITKHGDHKQSLTDAFISVNTELDYTQFDCQFSGSTLCTVLFLGNKLISANAGDSRAIVVRNSPTKSQKGVTSIQVEQLTRDHKPDEADEY